MIAVRLDNWFEAGNENWRLHLDFDFKTWSLVLRKERGSFALHCGDTPAPVNHLLNFITKIWSKR
jgi:hypothetical protein